MTDLPRTASFLIRPFRDRVCPTDDEIVVAPPDEVAPIIENMDHPAEEHGPWDGDRRPTPVRGTRTGTGGDADNQTQEKAATSPIVPTGSPVLVGAELPP